MNFKTYHPECTKTHHIESQNQKEDTTSPHPIPFGAFGTSILAPTALELGACGVLSSSINSPTHKFGPGPSMETWRMTEMTI